MARGVVAVVVSPTVAVVRGVPWWGVVSSAAAPVLLLAGWTVAAALQPRSYDALDGTVSALAAVVRAENLVHVMRPGGTR